MLEKTAVTTGQSVRLCLYISNYTSVVYNRPHILLLAGYTAAKKSIVAMGFLSKLDWC